MTHKSIVSQSNRPESGNTVRVLFLWARYSGYMAACWKQLAACPEIQVNVVAISSRPGDKSDPSFDKGILEGVSTHLVSKQDAGSLNRLESHLPDEVPDVIVLSGWEFPGYLSAVRNGPYRNVPVILCSDNPIRHTWRQRLGAFRIAWLMKRASLVFVPGERGFQLMKSWSLPDRKIAKGLYGVDEAAFAKCLDERNSKNWPRHFVFTGRYSERKGVDVMLAAYKKYRKSKPSPWGLLCCGRGELESQLSGCDGVVNRGFIQPNELPSVLSNASAFVLASRADAWPLSLVEAALSGLPIICTAACGSSAELVRDGFNGRVVPGADIDALAGAMCWAHDHVDPSNAFGQRSQSLGLAYTSSEWSARWREAIHQVNRKV